MTILKDKKDDLKFISLLRGIASLLIVWDHLVGIWSINSKTRIPILEFIRDYFTAPTGIIQDFGFLAVVIFFYVSGFIITFVGIRERTSDFALKRFFRIYPPYIVSISIILLSNYILSIFNNSSYVFSDITKKDFLTVASLANYYIVPQKVINGVAWTLSIEVIFYILCMFFIPLIRKTPFIATISISAICFIFMHNSRNYGDSFFLFSVSISYIPLLLIGQSTFLFWNKLINTKKYVATVTINYLLFIFGVKNINTQFYEQGNLYGVSVIVGFLLFTILMINEDNIIIPKYLSFFSKISYSLYLYHGSIGLLLLATLSPYLNYYISLPLVLTVVIILSFLSWKYIEKPSQHLARIIIKYTHNRLLKTKHHNETS